MSDRGFQSLQKCSSSHVNKRLSSSVHTCQWALSKNEKNEGKKDESSEWGEENLGGKYLDVYDARLPFILYIYVYAGK